MGRYVDESLGKGEAILYTARVSLWRYWFNFIVGSFFALIAIVAFLGSFASSRRDNSGYGTAIWFLVALLLLVWPFIARRSTELAITDKRLIAKYGVISTQSIEIRFDKIETVRVKQGLFGRMLNYGDIVVTGTGSTFDPIRNISNAKNFRNALNQAMDPAPGSPVAAAP